jgi:HTH-type transcriptional regulator/antitoxin HigA
MEPNPLKSNSEHEAALLEIERIWEAKTGTADGDRLEILMTLVEAYEETHFPINMPNHNVPRGHKRHC